VTNVQGVASLTANRLEQKIGEVPAGVLQQIRKALAFTTGMA
jgi:mRNA-degrading endonuclease toxin of MazEF toxin-antitoxin module